MILVLSILACGGDKPAAPAAAPAPKAEAPPPAPKEEGAFFVWYNPGKTIYTSADGKSWAPAGALPSDLDNFYNRFAADAGGRMYVLGWKASLYTSGDGGKSWEKVNVVSNPADTAKEYLSICAGAANELAMVANNGRTFWSTDAGQTWVEKGRIALEGGKDGNDRGRCAFSADGKTIATEISMWNDSGYAFAESSDGGTTWTLHPSAMKNYPATGIGFTSAGIANAWGGGYGEGAVSVLAPGGATWAESAKLRGTPAPEWARQIMATDGKNTVVVWQDAGKSKEGADVGNKVFVSTGGGKTFAESAGPVAVEPTPGTSDDYQDMWWHNGKTPGAMPAASGATPPAPTQAVATEPPQAEPPKAEAPKAEPQKEMPRKDAGG
ncbi:MAG: hypothetical protein FJ090_22730, partial [Deltaproteobacteria bacterium]|nr:hypothetical protein [Deltaproteobacteria bacterium]